MVSTEHPKATREVERDDSLRVRRFGTDQSDDANGAVVATDGGGPVEERPPAVAGQFYAGDEETLRDQLADCFAHEDGPGPVPDAAPVEHPRVVVAPHAGYPSSGPIAAHAYAAFAADQPDTVVVLGPNHEGGGAPAAVAAHDRWRTPLGTIPVDTGFAAALVGSGVTFDARSHAGEHSIEVHLPFLQHCCADVRVVPVCLTQLGRERAMELGRTVATAVDASERDVAVVVSTDLTHDESHATAVEADEPVVDAIAALDPNAVADAVADGHTMCGPWATLAGIVAARELGVTTGTRLQYATSGETDGRQDSVVGYAAVALG